MTTKDSPLHQLKAQADKIAALLKAAERGEQLAVQFAEKIAAVRDKPSIKIGIVMDDKVLTPEIPWETVRDLSEADLSQWIVKQMQGEPPMTDPDRWEAAYEAWVMEHEDAKVIWARRGPGLDTAFRAGYAAAPPAPADGMREALTDEDVERMVRAHDEEDAAQKGEPSPWSLGREDDGFEEWRNERVAAMKAALAAIPSPAPAGLEPRGCPTPGACSCLPTAPDEALAALIAEARVIEARLSRHTVHRRDGRAVAAGKLVNTEAPDLITRLVQALEKACPSKSRSTG